MQFDEKTLYELYIQESYSTLYEVLTKISFRYGIIKGAALSKQMYGEISKRFSSDIDILIPRSEINQFTQVLKNNDFYNSRDDRQSQIMMLSSSHQTAPWIKAIPPWGKVIIDINFDIFWGEYEGTRINIEEFLSDTIEMEIYGIKIKTLTPIKSLIQLILHHYKDMNSIFLIATRNSINREMFKDVYYLLINNLNSITVDKLYTICSKYDIIPYVFYILYYTGQIYEDKKLHPFIEAFRTPKGEHLLNCYGLSSKERKTWKCNFETRLSSNNLLSLIEKDLSFKDIEKIELNKHIFIGG